PSPLPPPQEPDIMSNSMTPPAQQQQQQQQQQQLNSMPPPTTPASKPTDPNDLADALTSAGIDLKAEEAQLASFVPGGPRSQEEIYQQAMRQQAEHRSHHLNNPFLNPRAVNQILLKKTTSDHCQPFNVIEPNGAISLAGQGADIMTLLSLASRERMRDLLTRAVALAKARRRPQGIIHGPWADQVAGVKPEMKIPDATISPTTPSASLGQKRSFDTANSADTLIPTVNLTNPVAIALRALKKEEYTKDQERKAKKARREATAGTGTPSGTPAPDGASTPIPGTPGSTAPEPGPKLSKEARKQQSSKLEEQISHRAANATASLMMGGLGGGRKKKKTYSWMNAGGAASAPAGPRPGVPGGIGTGVGVGRQVPGQHAGSADDQLNWIGHRVGVWREDGERGKGIQIRDWIGALEGDGRAPKKGVCKAYLKLK
ncbi:hypothetical protein EX30DRAFT_304589, partial [Ascodesmis nigricans]